MSSIHGADVAASFSVLQSISSKPVAFLRPLGDRNIAHITYDLQQITHTEINKEMND